jgi:hypothetical protein
MQLRGRLSINWRVTVSQVTINGTTRTINGAKHVETSSVATQAARLVSEVMTVTVHYN